MKFKSLFLVAFSSLSLFVACGPAQTSQEREEQQIQENTRRMKAVYAPFEGVYFGSINYQYGEKQDVVLYLNAMTQVVINPGRSDSTEVPTLGGSLHVCLSNGCTVKKDRKSIVKELLPIASFNAAKYNQSEGRLLLYFSGTNSSTGGTLAQQIDVIAAGNTLRGRFVNTSGMPGTIEVTKVE